MKNENDEKHIHFLISRNLKRLRASQGISQLQLALKAGLAHNFINEIENCKKGTSITTISKLCIALNVKPHEFFLPEDMTNDMTKIYVTDIKNSIEKVVKEVTDQYLQAND